MFIQNKAPWAQSIGIAVVRMWVCWVCEGFAAEHGCSDRGRPVEGDASAKLLTSTKHENKNTQLS